MALQRPEVDPVDGTAPTELVARTSRSATAREAGAGNTVDVHYVGVAHSSGRGVRLVVEARHAAAVPARRGPRHRRVGPGRRRDEGRRAAAAGDPAAPGLRRPRRGRRDPPGRDVDLRGGPGGRLLKLLLISDTHVPARARDLPAPVWTAVDAADVVVHAGDWVLGRAARRARGPGRAAGRRVGQQRRRRRCARGCPRSRGSRWTACGSRSCTRPAPPAGRERRCAAAYPDVDVLVFGHSHIPWDTTARERTAAAQPRLADRPAPPADAHLDDGRGRSTANWWV